MLIVGLESGTTLVPVLDMHHYASVSLQQFKKQNV